MAEQGRGSVFTILNCVSQDLYVRLWKLFALVFFYCVMENNIANIASRIPLVCHQSVTQAAYSANALLKIHAIQNGRTYNHNFLEHIVSWMPCANYLTDVLDP